MVAKWGNWVNDNKTLEEELREKHPGLKELWDKYQEMLRLVLPPEHNKVRQGENPADVLEQIRKRKAGGSSNGIRNLDKGPDKNPTIRRADEKETITLDRIKKILGGNKDI